MKQSDLNHLRRLLGWVRCDIGQAPAELQQTMIDVADGLGHPEISEEAKARMVETYRRAEAVPLYVRAAVKALEKALTAAGREPGAGKARATVETRANAGFDPGAAAGRAPALDDVQVERGLAEIGVHVWGPRAEDWLAGAEYAARILRGSEASPAAEPLQNHPGAAAYGVACRDTPAAPPTLRRDDTGGLGAARRTTPEKAEKDGDPETLDEILRRERGRMPLRLPEDPTLPPRSSVYAAPQASEAVLDAVRFVLKTFKADEAQGYRSRSRQFAISILEEALSAPLASAECTHAHAYRAVDRQGYVCQDCGAFVSDAERSSTT